MMRLTVLLLACALMGALVGSFYRALERVAESETLNRAVRRHETPGRAGQFVRELVFVLIAIPLVVGPFAAMMAIAFRFGAFWLGANAPAVIAAPITALLALGLTARSH